MRRAEGVPRPGDGQVAGCRTLGGRGEPLAFQHATDSSSAAVHDEPGHRDPRRARASMSRRPAALRSMSSRTSGYCGSICPVRAFYDLLDARLPPGSAAPPAPPLDTCRSRPMSPARVTRGRRAAASTPMPPPRDAPAARSSSAGRRPAHHVRGHPPPAQVVQLGRKGVVAEALGNRTNSPASSTPLPLRLKLTALRRRPGPGARRTAAITPSP